jgi:hypothetical protein
MFAVRGNDGILGGQQGQDADSNRFLADVQMKKTANLSQTVQLG